MSFPSASGVSPFHPSQGPSGDAAADSTGTLPPARADSTAVPDSTAGEDTDASSAGPGIADGLARYDRWQNLPTMFFEQAAALGDRPMLWARQGDAFRPTSGRQAAAEAAALAQCLNAIGIDFGDRVMLVSENRPEWLLADVAIMAAGAVTVPAYTTNTVADHRHILEDSMPAVAIVSTPALVERVAAAGLLMGQPPVIIAIEPPETVPEGITVVAWADALIHGRKHAAGIAPDEPGAEPDADAGAPGAEDAAALPDPDPPGTLAYIERDHLACIIYTSGTGGAPKGVMLSHRAILHNCKGACDVLQGFGLKDEVFLSFLPLSHSYEHTAGQFFPVSIGAEIYYAEGIERLAGNLLEARPTIMTAVPRLYEVLRARILHNVARQGGLQARLFNAALDLGRRRYRQERLGWIERIYDAVLTRLVRRKVAERLGGRLKAMVSGGAPLNEEVGLFFTALGVRILQGYGQTEAGPVVSCNRPDRLRLETVGPPLLDVEVRLADDGEILVRGPLLMEGYWNLPEESYAAIDGDGWLHTGDVGMIDADGCIHITDRKKDIIVNSGGDNISPQRIEGFLTAEPEISQAMVHGDRRPHLVAVIVPDQAFASGWAQAMGRDDDLALLADDPDFHREIAGAVDRVNGGLSLLEKVRHFILAPEPFTTANGLLTPTLKIRRHVIRDVYGRLLDRLYDVRGG